MKRLAILILKSADSAPFENTLVSVLANRPPNADVIVVCPGGYDDPYALADEVTFVQIPADAAGASWVREGLQAVAAECEIVHLLASGLEVDDGWTDEAMSQLEDESVAAVSPLVLGPDGLVRSAGIKPSLTGHLRVIGAGRKPDSRRLETWGPSLGAAFYRLSALSQHGALDPIFEQWLTDLDVGATLRSHGLRIELTRSKPIHGSVDVSSHCSAYKESQLKERFFWKHAPSFLRISLHPIAVCLEALGSISARQVTARALGRLVGMTQAPFDLLRRRRASLDKSELSEQRPEDPVIEDGEEPSNEQKAA